MRSVLVAALLLVSFSCTSRERAAVEGGPVILISVDTLRSDRLPAYGYGKVETPHFDALRRDGVLYERAYSHCPLTLPSHASMLTGLLPTEHGVRNNIGYALDPARAPTAARRLREAGYRTGAAVSSFVLRGETGIADGFESYDDDVAVTPGASTSEQQRSGFATVKAAQAWIARNASDRKSVV
jgi:arylsulfatase A-like enzyme